MSKNPYYNHDSKLQDLYPEGDGSFLGGGGGGGFEPTPTQMEAINSGATESKINQIQTNANNINNKLTKLTDEGEFVYSHNGDVQTSKGFEVADEPSGSAAHVTSSKTVKAVKTALTTEINKKVDKITGMAAKNNNRIYQCKLNDQGQVVSVETEFNWSNNYLNSAEDQLFTRKGANDMYEKYLKSTNGTLTKSTAITSDYSHYVKCGNIYQLSIGFQNSSAIAKDALLYTLPESISSSSIEMYIVISTVDGDTRILQCGGGSVSGNQIKAKQSIPAGYWFGSAIFIKV